MALCVPKAVVEVLALEDEVSVGGRARRKPSRMAQDVWEVAQEYVRSGGLLDLSEEIAALNVTEQELMRSDVSAVDRARERRQILAARGQLKAKQMELIKAREQFLTYDIFQAILDQFAIILRRHVPDAYTHRAISADLGQVVRQLSQQKDE